MAVGTQSDFQIYDEEFFGGMVEVLQQNGNAFGDASGGALRIVPERLRGEFERESFFQEISSLIARRDPTSTSSATDTAFTQDEFVSVKINRRIGPVSDTLDAFRKIATDPSEFSFLLGQQTGTAVTLDYLNTALLALEAALDNVSALEHDATDGTIETEDLVDGRANFGDAFNRLVAWVMHSKVYHDLVKDQIADAVYRANGIIVQQGTPLTLGLPVVVTDSSALRETDGVTSGTDAFSTLGLVANAGTIKESEQREVVSDLVTGEENLRMRIQGEHAYNLGLKGFQWDVTNGGANPNDAAVATGTNWDVAAADNRNLAGVIIKSQ